MGRFYKTAKPEMLDFMYKIPEKALFAAVQTADQKYEDQVKYLSDLEKYLQASVMESDQARTDEILKEAESQIKNFTLNLMDSPSAAINKNAEIRAFGQKLHENYTRGELAHYMNQKKAEDQFVAQESERLQKATGQVLPTDLENFRRKFKDMYNMPQYDEKRTFLGYKGGGQWDNELKKGKRSYYSERLANYIDPEKTITDLLGDTWAADGYDKFNSSVVGDHIIDTRTGEKVVEYNDVLQTAMSAFDNNREIEAYYKQLIRNGFMRMEDVYGEYEYNEKGEPTGRLAPLMIDEVDASGKPTGKKVEAKDAYGNVIPKNGGIKYDIAVNQARRLGFNQETSGVTGMKETEDYKAKVRMQEFMEQEAYKSKITGVDVTTGAVSVNVNGDGVENYEQLLDSIEKEDNQRYIEYHELLDGLLPSIADPNKKLKVKELIGNAFGSGKSEDWKLVDDYLGQHQLRGLEYTVNGKKINLGTGISEFANKQKAIVAKADNLFNYANNVAYDVAFDILKSKYSDWDKQTPEKQKILTNEFIKEYNSEIQNGADPTKKLSKKSKYDFKEKDFEKFKGNVDTKIKSVTKTTNNYTFFGGGEITESYAGDLGSYEVKEGLKAASTVPQVIDILGQVGSNAKFSTIDAATGKTVTNDFSLTEILSMLGSGITTKEFTTQLDNGTSSVITADNKLVFTTGTWKISPHDIPNMGVGTKQINIAYNELKDGKPTGQKKIVNVLVPGNSAIFNSTIEGSARAAAPDAAAVDLKKTGNNFYKNENNKIINKSNINDFAVKCKYGTGATYNPENDTWTIPGNTAPIVGKTGENAYAALLRQKNIFPNEEYTPKQKILSNSNKRTATFQTN